MINKDKSTFDITNPDDTDNTGAYLRSSDGTLLTHTDVNGKKSLDANITSSTLPDGASTELKQDDIITELQDVELDLESINTDLNTQFDETQVKQDLTNTELSNVNTELDTIRDNQISGVQKTQLVDSTNTNIAEIDSDKNLHTEIHGNDPQGNDKIFAVGGRVDSNSTNTPLGANATFTGSFVDCSQYVSIVFVALTDQMSAVNGAKIEFSTDGTVGGIIRTVSYTVSPLPGGATLSVPCEANFFRIVYTNGAIPQTVFKISTQLKSSVTGQTIAPLITPLEDISLAPINRAVITGKSTDGTYVNERAAGVSSLNSTATPLPANGEFLGDWEDCLGYSNISLTLTSDVASAIDGIHVQWSTDGVNVDNDDVYTSISDFSDAFSFGVITRYFRIKYVNGSDPQSFFRLQTILHISRPKPSTHRIKDPITSENDAELTKAVITGEDPNGSFVNKPAGGVSESNSTDTLLLAGEVFIGEFVRLKDYGGLSVAIDTDQNGTLEIEASSDGITVSGIVDSFNVMGGESFFIGVSPRRGFGRIKYTNGATNQTIFNLQTILSSGQLSASSQPINANLSSNSVATNSRSILAGQREDNTFSNVGLSNSSSIKVAVTDRPSQVLGRIKIDKSIENATLDATGTIIHTVTAGYTLYVTSILITALNSANAVGRLVLRDGTTTNKIPLLLAARDGSVPATAAASSPPLPEPLAFTTDIRAVELAGDITASILIVGYEEPN